MVEAIPKGSSAALVLRSIQDFKTKGGKLLNDLDLKLGMTPEQAVEKALELAGIAGGVDETRPVVLTILPEKKENVALGLQLLQDLVLMVPIADRDKILDGYKLPAKPKDKEIVVGNNPTLFNNNIALVVRGKYLCLAFDRAVLERLSDEPLAGVDAREKQQFGDADLLLYLGERAWPVVWGGYLDSLDRYFARHRDDEEKKVGEQFVKGLHATQHSFLGLSVADGVRLRSNMVFDVKKEKAARAMLEILKAGTSRSTLRGLPESRTAAALGWAGDGSKNGILTKLVFDVFLEGPLPGALNDLPVFARTDYPAAAGVTHELWQRLKGARIGLYQTQNEGDLGLFSAIAILDTVDGPAFIKELRTLAGIGNLTAADLKLPESKKLIDFEQMVRDLNSSTFRVREAAATRLLLVGEPALPHLAKAIDKPQSLEQKMRAERLKKEIDLVADPKRKQVLMPAVSLQSLRPSFAFAPNVEKRKDVTVDVLKMTFNTKDPAILKNVAQMLGPNWDKLRLAAVGNQVIVLVGSDADLLDQTIANVKADKGGLYENKLLAGFEKRADKDRSAEMHGSAQAFLGLVATTWKLPARLFRGTPELTSFAISFEADRLHLDLWVPTRELRTMVHAISAPPQ
jgi:hypothetical protein